jgi:transcriptional regulator with XRE-family HTH domain
VNNTRDEKRLKEFGLQIRKFRKAKKLTLEGLAFEADIELSQVHRIEKGKINPTLTTILLLADALEISPSKLFDYYK